MAHLLLLDDQEDLAPSLSKEWIHEKFSPALQPWKYSLENMTEKIERRETDIERKTLSKDEDINLLYEIETQRLKFLLASHQRVRLHKIEEYAAMLMKSEGQEEDLVEEFLSDAEKKMLRQYVAQEKRLYKGLLGHHDQYSHEEEDEEEGENEMVKTPSYEQFVFCKIKERINVIFDEEVDEESFPLEPGNVYVIRYDKIEKELEEGKCSLI